LAGIAAPLAYVIAVLVVLDLVLLLKRRSRAGSA
jgi:hypothetical protein